MIALGALIALAASCRGWSVLGAAPCVAGRAHVKLQLDSRGPLVAKDLPTSAGRGVDLILVASVADLFVAPALRGALIHERYLSPPFSD